MLQEFEARKGTQLAVLIVPTTAPEAIHDRLRRHLEDELAGVEIRPRPLAHGRPVGNGLSKNVAGADLNEPQSLAEQFRLRALTAARRSDEYRTHGEARRKAACGLASSACEAAGG